MVVKALDDGARKYLRHDDGGRAVAGATSATRLPASSRATALREHPVESVPHDPGVWLETARKAIRDFPNLSEAGSVARRRADLRLSRAAERLVAILPGPRSYAAFTGSAVCGTARFSFRAAW
jgi:hypothetical protein